MFRLCRSVARRGPPIVRYADCILLASAARARTRIHAPASPSDHGAPEPNGIRRDYIGAKPAPVCRGSTWSSGRWHGPRPHFCEAEEDHSPPLASCSEESCFTCRSGQDTDRNRRTNLEAVALQASGYATNGPEDLELVEAEEDVRELEQHVANQQIRIKSFQAASRNDDELKAREGLFLLTDALEIARRRLQAEQSARGTR